MPRRRARLLLALLARLTHGERARSTAPDGARRITSARAARPRPTPRRRRRLALHDWHVASDALNGGDVGFAEAYMDGRWDTPDLTRC